MIYLSLVLIAITAVIFYRIGLNTDIEVPINIESFNAGIAEGVSGLLTIFESKGLIRRTPADDDYEMPVAVTYDDGSTEKGIQAL